MIISRLNIDAFGTYSQRGFQDFGPGINILFGSNEWGKTTLLDFIRRTLFGYPSSRAGVNQYGAESGRSLRGRIECLLRNGDRILIDRVSGPKGGRLSIEYGGQLLSGQDALARFIGPISEGFFSNMYAFGIEELFGSGAFDSDEARSLIFGAGFGTGSISPAIVKNDLQKEADALFIPNGRKRPLNMTVHDIFTCERQLKDIGDTISHYEKHVSLRERLKQTADEVREQIVHVEISLNREQNYRKLYPLYVSRKEALSGLESLTGSREVSRQKREAIASLREQRQSTCALIDSIALDIRVKQAAWQAVVVDETIIEKQGIIEELKTFAVTYRNAKNDIMSVQRDRADLNTAIATILRNLGDNWTEAALSSFAISIDNQEALRGFRNRLRDLEIALARANDDIDMAESREIVESANATPATGGIWSPVSTAVLILSGIGLILSAWRSNWEMTIFAGIIIAGLLIARFGSRRKQEVQTNRSYRDILTTRKAQREDELNKEKESWRGFLSGIGIDRELEPESVEDCFRLIESGREKLRQARDLDRRIDSMNQTIAHVEMLYGSIRTDVTAALPQADVAAGMALLDKLLEDAREKAREDKSTAEQMRELTIRQEDASGRKSEIDRAIFEIMREYNIGGAEELDACIEASIKRESLTQVIADCEEKMAFTAGEGDALERCLANLDGATPAAIDERCIELRNELERMSEQSVSLHEEIGRLDAEIAALRGQEEASQLYLQRESATTRLNRQARQWMVASVAAATLDKAIASFEANRQPAVIALAGEYFKKITAGRYDRILLSVETDSIIVRESSDTSSKAIEMLSRGTREQLYLAMRLAAIEEYEKQAEPMPVIMDDILVNFDDARRRLAGEALIGFARDRQVVVMTCHQDMADLYHSLGGHQLQSQDLQ